MTDEDDLRAHYQGIEADDESVRRVTTTVLHRSGRRRWQPWVAGGGGILVAAAVAALAVVLTSGGSDDSAPAGPLPATSGARSSSTSATATTSTSSPPSASTGSGSSSVSRTGPPKPAVGATRSSGTAAGRSATTPTGHNPGPDRRAVSCAISDLAVADSGTDEQHDGRAYGRIVARNVSSSTCTIDGYPGLTLLSRHRSGPVPTDLSRAAGTTPSPVTLRPGATASFAFSRRVYDGGHCDAINGARIFDPDGSGYQLTDTSFRECEGITPTGLRPVPIQVGPFVAGSHATLP